MEKLKQPWFVQIKHAGLAVLRLLYFHPWYLVLAIVSAVFFYQLAFWFLNSDVFTQIILDSQIALLDKIDVIKSSYTGVFAPPFALLPVLLFTVSVLQGATIASLTYSIRKERANGKGALKGLAGTGIAGALSVLGLGCVSCGTSLVTPILSFFFASVSTSLSEAIGEYAMMFALVVALITLYFAGKKLHLHLPRVHK